SSSSKRDLKPTTRTLRSHARAKVNSLTLIQSSSNTYNNVRNDENEDDDDDGEPGNLQNNLSNKSIKIDKERSTAKTSSSS
ncbi:unnamed protein product, partial [Rotaria magnacalcarata]